MLKASAGTFFCRITDFIKRYWCISLSVDVRKKVVVVPVNGHVR